MADLKERIKVWKDYIKEHHNEYIKESLEGVDGVKMCKVDFESKTATVTFDNNKISREKIADTIAKETYYKVTDSKKKSWSIFGWFFGKG